MVTLRTADLADMGCVWAWRNDPSVRCVSFQTAPIPFEAHAAWFPRQLAKADARLWIIEQAQAVGYVRIDGLGHDAEIGIVVEPSSRGRGVAPCAIQAACQTSGAETVDALIRHDNPASIRAFKKTGFAHVESLTVQGVPSGRYRWHRRAAFLALMNDDQK